MDRDFAVELARSLAKVLGRQQIRPRYTSDGRYVVSVASQTLYELLKKPEDLERQKVRRAPRRMHGGFH